MLSDDGERDDTVGPYGKSLLYPVSNAFEGRRNTPLLRMQRFVQKLPEHPAPDREVERLFQPKEGELRSLVVAGVDGGSHSQSRSDSHDGFDKDEWTMNSVLGRILGRVPGRPFQARDLQY